MIHFLQTIISALLPETWKMHVESKLACVRQSSPQVVLAQLHSPVEVLSLELWKRNQTL